MNPMPHTDPPDEPPEAWWRRDVERRLIAAEQLAEANEKAIGAEIKVNIRRDELINGPFGLIKTLEANTEAIAKNTKAIEDDREKAIEEREKDVAERERARTERAQFYRRTALSLVISLFLIVATVLLTGLLQ
jgi:hypothetical protein